MAESFVTRQKRRPIAEINVVPYIDVMLVLLIIFMVTAGILAQGVDIELPKADAKALSDNSPIPIIASVDVEGQYYISIEGKPDRAVEPVDLAVEVAAYLQVDEQVPVMVRADRAVEYGKVVTLMALLQSAGVPSIGLLTEPAES